MKSPTFLPGCERRWWAFLEMSLYLFYICPSAFLHTVAVDILECARRNGAFGFLLESGPVPHFISFLQFAASLRQAQEVE